MHTFFQLHTKSSEKNNIIMILAKFKIMVKCFLVLRKGSQILPYTMSILLSKKVASLKKILVFKKKQLTGPAYSIKNDGRTQDHKISQLKTIQELQCL